MPTVRGDFLRGFLKRVLEGNGIQVIETLVRVAHQLTMAVDRFVVGDGQEPCHRPRLIEGPFGVDVQQCEPDLLDTILTV